MNLAQVTGSIDTARALPHEQALLLLAVQDYRQEIAVLTESLGNLRGNQPARPNPRGGEESFQDEFDRLAEWEDQFYRAQLAVARADCCFRLPLDHPYGEQLKPPEVEHWWDAPGMQPDCPEGVDHSG